MINTSDIREHAEVIGSDGKHVGTVDKVEGSRIKLTKADSTGAHSGHHHFIDIDLVETVQENRVHLSIDSQTAFADEQEASGKPVH